MKRVSLALTGLFHSCVSCHLRFNASAERASVCQNTAESTAHISRGTPAKLKHK